jgi:predicted regulator of Ras-like GTPase activity (Roadblock/LC7/MglB family)
MLSVNDQLVIEKHLRNFLGKSEAQWTALVDRGGNLDVTVLSALAAGSFSVTKELAKRLGEKEFMALYHEGLHISILMMSLYYDCLLLTVFSERTNIGLVRFYARQTFISLNACLETASQSAALAEPLTIDFELSEEGTIIS